MSDEQDHRQDEPEAQALSGNPDHPPQQADDRPDNDRELLGPAEDEEERVSGKPAPDGSGGSDQPGTTLPGYG